MQEPRLGAHLATPRWGFEHHGIYAGNGRVIQYTGFKGWLRIGPVEEFSLAEFTRGRGFVVKDPSKFKGEEAVARARSRVGENLYRLLTNNCEHFAEWCVSGASRSLQVERAGSAFQLKRSASEAKSPGNRPRPECRPRRYPCRRLQGT